MHIYFIYLFIYWPQVFEVFNDNRELLALKVVDLSESRVRDELVEKL